MLERPQARALVERLVRRNPVTLLAGPRQCGKTTLAREIASQQRATYFDLEDSTRQFPLRSFYLT
jgi:uncharacterized protein